MVAEIDAGSRVFASSFDDFRQNPVPKELVLGANFLHNKKFAIAKTVQRTALVFPRVFC